ncbi:MAG: dihydrolipoyl dehydrogenase [Candidatus Bathyarchaeota archaeon]|nr:MAG: dihydrolipoyl dehydrogenase [Candidatus Bathyarchaeota archaeon]
MKEYDLISIGTGSAMNIVSSMVQENPQMKVAVIDKDDPGGICLTRGCIPSKLLLYPAELVRIIGEAEDLGIDVNMRKIDFKRVMDRMRALIRKDIDMIRRGLSNAEAIDYYPTVAEFISPYTLKVGDETVKSKMIFLCAGSKPIIPPIKGLEEVGFLTSDTVLNMSRLPESIAIVGGGYIAAEYGHFFSAMGSKVTIIGRNPQFLKQEEPEVSALAKRELEKHMAILTNHEVHEAEKTSMGEKKLIAVNRESEGQIVITADEILVAAGRGPNTDILHPERAGIETDKRGWIIVNEYLETSQPNIWAFGDANGRHLFKHAANYESVVVYSNAVLKKRIKADYHAIPHAVFTYPEIGSVGLGEKGAVEKYGEANVLIGMYRYEDTAKGEAMAVKDYFVKVIVEKETQKILGAHIIGPYASVLVQEIVNLMYTPEQSATPITNGMHIHPALNEVVERAFRSLMPPEQYRHLIERHTF